MVHAGTVWRVRLFDGPALERIGGDETTRFRSAKVQSLLAFLALRLGHPCPRETLADALWPEEPDAAVTANRLRVTLASLRRQMEPPGVPYGTVLDASQPGLISLRAATVTTDVVDFERAYAAGRRDEAARLLHGPLLPGLYDDWVRSEQLRYEALRDALAEEMTPFAPASVEPPDAPPPEHRLPLYLTRFVGRERERETVRALLGDGRLVTLTGPGGIGKTRLAVESAAEGPWSALFVPLAEYEGSVAEAILRALGTRLRPDSHPEDVVFERLRERRNSLLVLDDVDALVDAVAEASLRLLALLPELRILATGRQRLELPGETVFVVPPLATEDEAEALFVERARHAVPDFVARGIHAEAVAAICRRLEGMPLALELAAARVAFQTPARIAEELEGGLMELRSRQRGLAARHRSLRAAIQGSVDLLSPELRLLFARLSVFQGGWTAPAAAEVCDEPRADKLMEELVVRSLARAEESTDGMRFSFLEPLREAARELRPVGDPAAEGHAAYFLRLAATATEDDLRTLAPLDAESENLRLALAHRDHRLFWPALAGALTHAFVRGGHRQAVEWIEENLDEVGKADPAARFRWRYAACQILPDVGHLDETERLARAMAQEGSLRERLYAEVIQAYVQEMRGDLQGSLSRSGEVLAQARKLGERHLLETCLSHRSGTLHVYGAVAGDATPEGHAALQEAEGLARELGRIVPAASRRVPLASLLRAAAIWPQNRPEEATSAFREAQTAALRLGTTTELMYAFVSEASLVAEHDPGRAILLYGAFLTLQERMGYRLERAQAARPPWITQIAASLRGRLGESRFAEGIAQGRNTPPAELVLRPETP